MLVISNGAMKSGSTWLANIILRMVDHEPLPEGYQDPLPTLATLPVIRKELLRKFLNEVDYHARNYVSVNHFFYTRPLLSRYKDVYAVDITRNMPDTLLSVYMHERTRIQEAGGVPDDAKQAYWERGAALVESITRYHAIWGKPSAWTYVVSYEQLKKTPAQVIAALAAFLGLTLSEERIACIIRDTSLSALASALPEDSRLRVRFRKGEIGEHAEYLDPAILEDIRRIEAKNAGYPKGLVQRIDYAVKCWRDNRGYR